MNSHARMETILRQQSIGGGRSICRLCAETHTVWSVPTTACPVLSRRPFIRSQRSPALSRQHASCEGCGSSDHGKRSFGALLPSGRQGYHRRHLDSRRRTPERAELLRVEKHHRAARAGVEGGGVQRPVLALHSHGVPAIKAADAAPPLPGRSPHGRSLPTFWEAGKSSVRPGALLNAALVCGGCR